MSRERISVGGTLMEDQKVITQLLKETRLKRGLEPSELASVLGIPEDQYREMEFGKLAMTAEQLLVFMRQYQVSFDCFNFDSTSKSIQKLRLALKNWGASYLGENETSLIHSQTYDLYSTIIEVLVAYPTKELICALCPVLIKQRSRINFDSIGMRLYDLGIDGRLWWVVEACIWAVRDRVKWFISSELKSLYQEADEMLGMKSKAANAFFSLRKAYPVDIVDQDITTIRIMEKVRQERDTLATRWRNNSY
jgi:transcriptional regulator with XRE-family HTH domain